jgi:hypothetical protein
VPADVAHQHDISIVLVEQQYITCEVALFKLLQRTIQTMVFHCAGKLARRNESRVFVEDLDRLFYLGKFLLERVELALDVIERINANSTLCRFRGGDRGALRY